MGAKSSIEWTDASWSPLRARVRQDAAAIALTKGYTSLIQIATKTAGHPGHHCEHVSEECFNCYSEAFQRRCLKANGTGLPFDRRTRDLVEPFVDQNILMQPLGWKTPKRIFVESQSDLFGEWNTFEMIDEVFTVMIAADWHTYQILTKRPKRMREYFSSGRHDNGVGPDRATYHLGEKIWLGVSAGTQKAAAERIPELLLTPADVRFVSAEPLLESLHLSRFLQPQRPISWVVVGGESGPGASPMHPDWARKLRDDCGSAGVPFFFKQWGEWAQLDKEFDYYTYGRMVRNNSDFVRELNRYRKDNHAAELLSADNWLEGIRSGCIIYGGKPLGRVGKHRAGRLLDGVEHNGLPALRPLAIDDDSTATTKERLLKSSEKRSSPGPDTTSRS